MSPPSPRHPGASGPTPSTSTFTDESPVGFLGLVGAVVAGALLSGIAIVLSEAIAGNSGAGEFDVYPLLYFMGGILFSIPLSILGISLYKEIIGRSHPGLFSMPCFFVPMAALITGITIPSIPS